MKNQLLIIGASGHGKVVADIALKLNKWKQIFFLDDDDSIVEAMGIKVIGKTADAFLHIEDSDIFVAVGDNTTRKVTQEKLESLGANIPVLIHPNAVIGDDVSIKEGTVIMAGVVINCCSNIGKGCIINTSSTVDHDNEISDFVHISPGAHLSGSVSIGENSWIGTGCDIINNISITDQCIIGAGSVVIKDIKEPGTYVGIPVRRLENEKDINTSK